MGRKNKIENYVEPVFSSNTFPMNFSLRRPTGAEVRLELELESDYDYFKNDRMNDLYSGYNLSTPQITDNAIKKKFYNTFHQLTLHLK